MIRGLSLLLLAVFTSPSVLAAEFCATNSTELQSALSAAASNGQDDVIRLATGNYPVIGSNQFSFSPAASDEDNDIEIIGGFTPFFDFPCGQVLLADPTLTVLDGNNTARVMRINPPELGSVTIRNLTFSNGAPNDSSAGGGLLVLRNSGETFDGTLTLENNVFLANSSNGGGALRLNLAGASNIAVRVLNNMFVGNESTAISNGTVLIRVRSDDPPPTVFTPRPLLAFAHNTVINNDDTSTTPGNIGGVSIGGDVRNVWVASNNLWGNSGDDLSLFFDPLASIRLFKNNIEDLVTSISNPPDFDQGNISVAPDYVSCGFFCIERVPTPDSPLIDAGYAPGGFSPPWSLPANDLRGQVRLADEAVDIGAYEGRSANLFSDRFQDN